MAKSPDRANAALNAQIKASGSSVPSSRPSKTAASGVRGINSDSKKKEPKQLISSVASPLQQQLSSPPGRTPDEGAFGIDAFRDGGGPETASDSLAQSRVLTEQYFDEDAATLWLSSGETDLVSAYGRFFMQSIVEQDTEKYQVVETFTDFYVFFYGRRPPIYRYSGLLINDPNYRWVEDMKFMYDNYFRGSAASELGATTMVQYEGRQVFGQVLGFSIQQDAVNHKAVPFSLDVLVLDYQAIKFSDDISELLNTKTAELAQLRAQIQAELSLINQNQNTGAKLRAGKIFNGKAPASGPTSAADEAKKEVSSNAIQGNLPKGKM